MNKAFVRNFSFHLAFNALCQAFAPWAPGSSGERIWNYHSHRDNFLWAGSRWQGMGPLKDNNPLVIVILRIREKNKQVVVSSLLMGISLLDLEDKRHWFRGLIKREEVFHRPASDGCKPLTERNFLNGGH